MKKILVVAYHFPPVGGLGAAGSQRMHKFAKHLPAFGWEPTVLTAKVSAYESYLKIDPTLLDEVSPNLTIVRTRVLRLLTPLLRMKNALLGRADKTAVDAEPFQPAPGADVAPVAERTGWQKFKDSVTDLFEIPDEVAGWIWPAVFGGYRVIRKQKIDAILATGRPWSTLVIGALLKKLTGRPLIVDFRDPWMTNPFRIQHSGLKNKLEAALEKRVIRAADLIVANTDTLREEFVERFGAQIEERCITVLNGYDAEEFAKVRATRYGSTDQFLLLHAGFLYGKRDPKVLIDAVAQLRDNGDIEPSKFRCDLLGSVELSYDLPDYLQSKELDKLVHLHGEVSYGESIAALAGSDLALLLQPGTTTQIPSKVFEYIGLGKRILTIAPTDSSVASLIRDANLGPVADQADVQGVAAAIKAEMRAWSERGDGAAIEPAVQRGFEVSNSVRALCRGIDTVTGKAGAATAIAGDEK